LRELGQTGESVSAIGLGCMGMVGWYGTRDDAEARACIDRAIDLGISHFDTAAVYQNGDNERFVGDCIRGRRNRVFLATKGGLARGPDGRASVDCRPEAILHSCDESLARLKCGHIDLYYLHRVDRAVPIEESMQAMVTLVAAGKIRYVGLSEASPETLRRAHAAHPVAALQSELSLSTPSASRAALEVCAELGIGFVAYSPLGRGLLSGAVAELGDLPATDTRRAFPRFSAERLPENLEMARRVQRLALRYGCSPAQLALAWVLAQGNNVLAIPGTKKRRFLQDKTTRALPISHCLRCSCGK
jgi:aryl-alcohol dehydrogenase-like predicted oxidoreductase